MAIKFEKQWINGVGTECSDFAEAVKSVLGTRAGQIETNEAGTVSTDTSLQNPQVLLRDLESNARIIYETACEMIGHKISSSDERTGLNP